MTIVRTRTRSTSHAFPKTVSLLAIASCETIWRRALLMAQGICTLAEYRRMTEEKAAAWRLSTAAFIAGRSQAAILAPFVGRARANARRLRRKG
jgi:hypothetical protein